MLKVNNLCKSFGNNGVLNNVSIIVNENSILGLAGTSGGGKSTLLRCIQKLEPVDSGTIEYEGHAGFMFQDFQLFPHMTVLENLVYAPAHKNKRINYTEQAMTLLENLSMAGKADSYPQDLSGGQKQRVALARSLMMHPRFLLCDEPTSGLDVATTLEVVTLLKSIKDRGVTMIIASHDLDFLTRIADRIVVLKDGDIVLDVDPQTLTDPIQDLKKYYAE